MATVALMFLQGCDNRKHSFSIRLVRDGALAEVGEDPNYYIKRLAVDLDHAQLSEEPLISEKDILSYDWETHTVRVADGTGARMPGVGSFGTPFIVVADGHRCYVGALWSKMSSVGTTLPVIKVQDAQDGEFGIQLGYPGRHLMADDPRSDERIRRCLGALGKLGPQG